MIPTLPNVMPCLLAVVATYEHFMIFPFKFVEKSISLRHTPGREQNYVVGALRSLRHANVCKQGKRDPLL